MLLNVEVLLPPQELDYVSFPGNPPQAREAETQAEW